MPDVTPQRIFRFAPSPNGYLHLGHARSALLNHDLAQACGGRFLLRIEDIDCERAKPEFEQAILEDLAWLGLRWEEPVRRQSDHFGDYAYALERLEAMGLLYGCFCSRGDIARAVADRTGWPRDPDGAPIYPGTCLGLTDEDRAARRFAGAYAARRLHMGRALARIDSPIAWREFGDEAQPRVVRAEPGSWGDVILSRKDVPASYHIAVVVDDALQGVTDVVRGADLLPATSLHRLLQILLDLPAPDYRHHALALDAEGRKLAKSAGSTSLRDLRAQGVTPEQVRVLAGLPQQP